MGRGSDIPEMILGIGGLVLCAAAFVTMPFRIELDGDPEAANSVFGISMLVWIGAITFRHLSAHRGRPGVGWLVAAWVLLGPLVVWAILQSLGSAAFDDGLLDGLRELVSSPPRVILILPLGFASVAILLDRSASEHEPDAG